jgi:hypothetical protein
VFIFALEHLLRRGAEDAFEPLAQVFYFAPAFHGRCPLQPFHYARALAQAAPKQIKAGGEMHVGLDCIAVSL